LRWRALHLFQRAASVGSVMAQASLIGSASNNWNAAMVAELPKRVSRLT